MKKINFFILFFCVFSNFLFAQNDIEKIFDKLLIEYSSNPATYLNKYASEDFIFILAEGQIQSKGETLQNLSARVSKGKLVDLKITNRLIKSYGNIHVASGIASSKWAFGDIFVNSQNAFTYTYQIIGNDIKWIHAQHSVVTPKERNKSIYLNLNRLQNEGKINYEDFYAETHEIKGVGKGPKAVETYSKMYATSFPDLKSNILDIVSEGDLVFARCEVSGTHTGEFMGIPPTNKMIKISHWTVNRFNEEGKITESWNLNDDVSLYKQLGLMK
jgi:predicted ester cyclase